MRDGSWVRGICGSLCFGALLALAAGRAAGQPPDPVKQYELACAALGIAPAACPAVTLAQAQERLAKAMAANQAGAAATLAAIRLALGLPAKESEDPIAELQAVSSRLKAAGIPLAPRDAARRLPFEAVSHPDPNVLERSHLYPGFQGNLLDAQIALHIFFYDNFKKLYAPVPAPAAPTAPRSHVRHAVSWSFTPLIRVRILDRPSGPIKTLSWMPKTDLQHVTLWRQEVKNPDDERPRALTLHFTVGHHSNGQDECTYVRGLANSDPACVDPADPAGLRINYPNGSFSTNYLRFGVSHKWLRLRNTPFGVTPRRTHTATLSFETNPEWLKIGGTLPPAMKSLYGGNRVRGQYEFETRVGPASGLRHPLLRGSLRLTGSAELIDKLSEGPEPSFTVVPGAPLNELWTPGRGSSRFRFSVEAAWNPDALRGWGLQARYWHGQDPYNLRFVRDIHWFQAGIMFDAGELQRFLVRRR